MLSRSHRCPPFPLLRGCTKDGGLKGGHDMAASLSEKGNAKNRPGWARGHGRHGGEASALWVGTDDVGLDSLALSYQEERAKTNVRSHRCPPPHRPVTKKRSPSYCFEDIAARPFWMYFLCFPPPFSLFQLS